jgi:nitrate reductase NapE component
VSTGMGLQQEIFELAGEIFYARQMKRGITMRRTLNRQSVFFNLTVFVTLIAFMGCSIKNYPGFSRNANEFKTYQKRNNIAMALDPFIEKERLEKFFGVDLLNEYTVNEHTYAILPVYVAIENMGDHSVLLRVNDVQFLTVDGTVIGDAVDANTASMPARQSVANRQSALNTFAMIGVCIFPLLIGVMLAFPFVLSADATDRSVEVNTYSKALREKSIGNGEANSGFVYFLVKDNEIETLRNVSKLRVNIKNLDTSEKTAFDFEINSVELSKRVAKINLKPAEVKK